MNVQGKLVKILPIETGTSKAGKEWKKQNFIIDIGAKYNPEICFQLFGDEKLEMIKNIKIGREVDVNFNVSSREYNGKYFHNLDAWKVSDIVSDENIGNEQNFNEGDIQDGDLPF